MMLDDRAAIYNLTRTFGVPGTLYVSDQTTATKTGLISRTLTPYRFKRIIKLPRKMNYAVTPVNDSGQKMFSYVSETIPFLFMREDLPKNVFPRVGNYIVVARQGYSIESVEDYADGVMCRCKKISGDVPKQVFTLVMKDVVTFTESLENE